MPRTTRSNTKKKKATKNQVAISKALADLGIEYSSDQNPFAACDNSADAEFKIAKKHYHRTILKTHPDKGGDAATFRRVQASFDLLKTLQKKNYGSLFEDALMATAHTTNDTDDNEEDEDDDEEGFDFDAYYAEHEKSFGENFTPSWEFYQQAAQEDMPTYKVELAKSNRSKCQAADNSFKRCSQGQSTTTEESATLVNVGDAAEKIYKDELRVGWLNDQSGTYSRWVHLRCWKVPVKVWMGLPQDAASEEEFQNALEQLDEILLTGFCELPEDKQQEFIRHVRNKENWAKAHTQKQRDEVFVATGVKLAPTKKRQKEEAAAKEAAQKKKAAKAAAKKEDSKPAAELVVAKPSSAASVLAKLAASDKALVPHKQHFVVPIPGKNGASEDTVFEGQTFVLTGVFPEIGGGTGLSQGKDKVKAMIESFGGRVTSAISGKTNVLVVGKEPGMSKVSKARARPKVKLAHLHDLKIGLDAGLEQLQDFEFFQSEEPLKIQSFSSGYQYVNTGYNGLALQASQEELAIAQGLVPAGGEEALLALTTGAEEDSKPAAKKGGKKKKAAPKKRMALKDVPDNNGSAGETDAPVVAKKRKTARSKAAVAKME